MCVGDRQAFGAHHGATMEISTRKGEDQEPKGDCIDSFYPYSVYLV